MSGTPAAARKVGIQSSPAKISVKLGAGLDHAGPADEGGDAPAAFPVGVFLTAEGGGSGIRVEADHGAVVGGVNDDGVRVSGRVHPRS